MAAKDLKGNDTVVQVPLDSTGYMSLDELTTFLGKDNWALAARVPFLVTLYSREEYRYETKKEGRIDLKNCALSLLACTAPEWMNGAISPLMFEGGFMDRTLYIYRPGGADRSYPTPGPLDPVTAIHLAKYLRAISCQPKPVELFPNKACTKFYEDWYNSQPKIGEFTSMTLHRKANHAWKLAGVLSLSAATQPHITEETFKEAIDILDAEESRFMEFLTAVDKAPEADLFMYIAKMLLRWGGDATQSKLFNSLRQKRGLSPPNIRAVPILQAMAQMGWLEIQRVGRGVVYKLTEEGREHARRG
jgi:DNA-binding MarR family transcriptional regulator